MTNKRQMEYRKAVHDALERSQFVEETLREYLDLAIEIAKIAVGSHFPVRVTTKDLSRLSLGRLVELFSRFNGNTSLKSELRQITPDRNRIAHKSLLFTLGELEDDAHMSKLTVEVKKIARKIKNTHNMLLDERVKLLRSFQALKREKK